MLLKNFQLLKFNFNSSDKILFTTVYPVIAISFIFIANDNSFFQLIQIPSFFTDVLFAIIITYIIGIYAKYISVKLYHGKNIQIKKIIKIQFFQGILLPLFLSMILEIIYLYLIDIPFQNSSILNLEMPLTFLYLMLINFYYFTEFLFKFKKIKTDKIILNNLQNSSNELIKFIVVNKGSIEEKIKIENCSFIKSENKLLWLNTSDGNHYRLQGTLEEWENKIGNTFFKINRQFIVASQAIQSVEYTETRKLKVNLFLSTNEAIYISKANSVSFRNWWKSNCPS